MASDYLSSRHCAFCCCGHLASIAYLSGDILGTQQHTNEYYIVYISAIHISENAFKPVNHTKVSRASGLVFRWRRTRHNASPMPVSNLPF